MAKKSKSGTDDEDTQSVWRSEPAAVYGLEHPVTCPNCKVELDRVYAVRLFRAKVNFMSSLPRSGRVLACPSCRVVLPGELGAVL